MYFPVLLWCTEIFALKTYVLWLTQYLVMQYLAQCLFHIFDW